MAFKKKGQKEKNAKKKKEAKLKQQQNKKNQKDDSSSDEEAEQQQTKTEVVEDTKKSKKEKNKEKKKLKAEAEKQASMPPLTVQTKDWLMEDGCLSTIRGLYNLGNTCFFNSVMQCLTQTRLLVHHFIDFADAFKAEDKKEFPTFAGPLTISLMVYFTQIFQGKKGGDYNPMVLFKQITKNAPRFAGYQQQDAHELLRYLEIIAQEEYKQKARADEKPEEKSEEEKKEEEKKPVKKLPNNIIDKTFGSKLCSTILCHNCGNMSQRMEDALDLSVPIPKLPPLAEKNSQTISELFEQLCKEEATIYEKHTDKILNPNDILDYIGTLTQEKNDVSVANCLWGFSKLELLSEEKSKNGYLCEKCSYVEVTEEEQPATPVTPVTEDGEKKESSSEEDEEDEEEDANKEAETKPEEPAEKPKQEEKKKKKIYRDASKQYSIYEPPNVLTVHLKRFTREDGRSKRSKLSWYMNVGGYVKSQSHVNFPLNLDLSSFVHPGSEYAKKDNRYALYGVVEHSGSLLGGHYVAYVKKLKVHPEASKESRDKWYYVSDTHFKEVSVQEVKKAQAYMLFYERVSGR